MIVPFSQPAGVGVRLFYPGDSLVRQVSECIGRMPGYDLEACFARSLPEIREALGGARVAVLDATADPAQATDAFLQAVGKLGAYSVAVYTEQMHDGLELFVRRCGALLLLGPLNETQWMEFFQQVLRQGGREHAVRRAA